VADGYVSDRNTTPDAVSIAEDDKMTGQQFKNSVLDTRGVYTPIKSLNTFLFDWKIKARVTKKHTKKAWKNQRGAGCLLNIELIDLAGS
jgi:hypothetical protein